MDLSRRNVLSALGLLIGTPAAGRTAAGVSSLPIGGHHGEQVAPAASKSGAGLALVLRFRDGTSRTFSQDSAKDAGDYVGQFVHQRCFVVQADEWTVFFRPDADGSRDEIVVERGLLRLVPGQNPTHILEPYGATILKDGRRIAELSVPRHWWLARWRWQSAPRPVKRSLRDLIAMKAICPLAKGALYGAKLPQTAVRWQGPMDLGGLQVGMGGVGEREEIGPITEYQAAYLLDGNPGLLTAAMAQAEAVGSMPIWARDQSDGALVDVYEMPNLSFLAEGVPSIPQPPYPYNPDHSYNDYLFRMEVAHIPSAAYVPWLLTDDPFFYEGVEATANFGVLFSDYHRAVQKLPGLVYPGETRAWGWGMREAMRLAAFALEQPPSWLKPRNYWKRIVTDNLTFTKQYMASPAKIHRVFRMFTRSDLCEPFFGGYVMSTLGWAVWSGFYPEWSEFTSWFAGGLISFVDGKSGWDRRWPAPYMVDFLTMRDLGKSEAPPATLAVLDGTWDARTPDSWAEAWELFPRWALTPAPFAAAPKPLDSSRWSDLEKVYENGIDSPYGVVKSAPSGPYYPLVMRAALAYAALAAVPGAKPAHDWLHSKLPAVCASYGAPGYYKWSVEPA
jgi:hypothetical protein